MKRFVISGGGTGGHLYPALNIRDCLRKKGIECFYIGSKRGIESRIVKDGIFFEVYPWIRNEPLSLLKAVFYVLKSLYRCLVFMRHKKIDTVIITGGYVSFVVAFSAVLSGIPLIIQEQNAYPGLTNRIFSIFAKCVYVGFEGINAYFPFNFKKVYKKCIIAGNPVRDEFMDEGDENFVLFLGGSQGSKTIGKMFLGLKDILIKNGYKILFITGERFFDIYKEYTDKNVEIISYSNTIWKYVNRAKFIISRSGALTVSEIIKSAKVSLLVPYPFSAGNHQYFNAMYLCKQKCAFCLNEDDDFDYINIFNDLENMYNIYKFNIKKLSNNRKDFFEIFERLEGL